MGTNSATPVQALVGALLAVLTVGGPVAIALQIGLDLTDPVVAVPFIVVLVVGHGILAALLKTLGKTEFPE